MPAIVRATEIPGPKSRAILAGCVIADLHAGDHDRGKDVAFYRRRPSGIPPEPLGWLGYHEAHRQIALEAHVTFAAWDG